MAQEPGNSALRQNTLGEVLDSVFAISCPSLPVDHAYALSNAILSEIPWFAQEPSAGLHTVHGAQSGGGWMRPEGPDAMLQLSRRAKLVLRLPRHRLEDAAALVGRTLHVSGWPLRVDGVTLRPLSRITTLFSRSVMFVAEGDEAAFMAAAAEELGALGIKPERMLCGRVTPISTPDRIHHARSLMLAGLTVEQSLALQKQGLGEGRKFGCGLFLPHKDIADLRSRSD